RTKISHASATSGSATSIQTISSLLISGRFPRGIDRKYGVMFQETPDKRVVDACRKLRFASVIELSSGWQALASEGPPGSTAGDMEILCRPAGRGDSWAAFRTADHALLNMNDCICLTEADLIPIKRAVGNVDTLVTQFSYASWWGNASDPDAWRVAAREQLEKIRREVEVLRPKFVLLSASFVYFCHSENWYMNQFVNSVEDAFRFVSRLAVTPIVLYPGETWMAGTQHDSKIALAKYKTDFDRAIECSPLRKTNPVPIETLQAAAREFIARLRRRNSRLLLWRIPPTCIAIKDHGRRLLKLSLDGLEDSPQRGLSADIV